MYERIVGCRPIVRSKNFWPDQALQNLLKRSNTHSGYFAADPKGFRPRVGLFLWLRVVPYFLWDEHEVRRDE